MQTERWYWLPIFCLVSSVVHVGLALRYRSFTFHIPPVTAAQIEVTLEPPELPRPLPPPPKQPEPAPKPQAVGQAPVSPPQRSTESTIDLRRSDIPPVLSEREPDKRLSLEPPRQDAIAGPARPVNPAETRLAAPIPIREKPPVSVTSSPLKPPELKRTGRPDGVASVDSPYASVMFRRPKAEQAPRPSFSPSQAAGRLEPRIRPGAAGSILSGDNPLVKTIPHEKIQPPGLANGLADAGTPRFQRIARADRNLAGGSPAPGPVLGGRGGAIGPERPSQDVMFAGKGAGGLNLPRVRPRIGGGGGRSIMSVDNPLARDAIPEDRPGIGPGLGGGQGVGAGGGVGHSGGPGIGTRRNGRVAVGTLRAKPGTGIGAASGSGIGTRSPRGGAGAGSELPGTGGTGAGYGRGNGSGIGGTGGRMGSRPGMALGDIGGLLRPGQPSGAGGIPQAPGRGVVFGPGNGPAGGGGPIVRIVYVLDTSNSMKEGDKLNKAAQALKLAIAELKPADTFNIITFYQNVTLFSKEMAQAIPENLHRAMVYSDTVATGYGTNLSGALEAALALKGITHIYVISDGEPTDGITDPLKIRALVRERNTQKAQINTLALGLTKQQTGMELMKAIAEENHGTFGYIDLSR